MKKNGPTFQFEDNSPDCLFVAGIDEVGRGALAGPLTVGLVLFNPQSLIEKEALLSLGINDSKLLTARKREHLAEIIKDRAYFWHVVSISPEEINNVGISKCFGKAVSLLADYANEHCQYGKIAFLIDGNPISHIPYKHRTQCQFIIKGDMKSISIAAASILAKVERDSYMTELSFSYPSYAWNINKGYGTQAHRDALRTHGPTPHHRTLYIRNTLINTIHLP